MQDIILIIIAICAIITYIIISTYRKKRKLIQNLAQAFGKTPIRQYSLYDMESMTSYWQEKQKKSTPEHSVDATTWNDLDMEKVYKRINHTCSSVGEEYLYSTLHEQTYNQDNLKKTEEAIQYFDTHEAERLKVQVILSKLGISSGNRMIELLFHPSDKRLQNRFIYPILSIMVISAIITIFFNRSVGIPFLALMLIINVFVYYKTKINLEVELSAVRYFSSLITCAKKISKLDIPTLEEYTQKTKKTYHLVKNINRFVGSILSTASSEMDFIFEYVKILFMVDFIFYNLMLSSIEKYAEECIELYETIGFLDMAISIASYRKSVAYCTQPTFTTANEIVMRELVHPLIEEPIANTITLKKNSIITGSNASGKSTFVKAIAINCILSQTIHTCLAEQFCIQPSFVVTSMAVNDNIEVGESYYIAEIKSLKRILQSLNKDVRCLCFIDEILKGTNTIERIAASAAILDYLKNKNCLALVATHDIELTEITYPLYDNYHFQESITDDGMLFDYKIYEGKTETKNAIKLLEFLGYDQAIIKNAKNLAQTFEEDRVWGKLL